MNNLIHYCLKLTIILSCIAITTSSAFSKDSDLTADEIMKRHTAKQNIEAEVEFVTIKTIGGGSGSARYAILFCTQKDAKGHHQYLIRVVSPAKFNGVGLLARHDEKGEMERYFYLPALGQVKRVMGKGKSPNFLGSNFTYEDLMKESPDNYNYERMADQKLNDVNCFVIRASMSKVDEDEELQYVYRDIYIDQAAYNIQKINFVGPDSDEPLKTLRAYEYKSVKVDGPTMRPLRADMVDHESGSKSTLTVMRSRFNEKIDDNYFTPEGLANWDNKQKDKILGTFKANQKQ